MSTGRRAYTVTQAAATNPVTDLGGVAPATIEQPFAVPKPLPPVLVKPGAVSRRITLLRVSPGRFRSIPSRAKLRRCSRTPLRRGAGRPAPMGVEPARPARMRPKILASVFSVSVRDSQRAWIVATRCCGTSLAHMPPVRHNRSVMAPAPARCAPSPALSERHGWSSPRRACRRSSWGSQGSGLGRRPAAELRLVRGRGLWHASAAATMWRP
jgi:hypothetical protein